MSVIGVRTKGKGSIFLGELSLLSNKETRPLTSTFKVQTFSQENSTELYVHFTSVFENVYHNLYYLNAQNEKIWLGRTAAQDFYISKILTKNGIIDLEVQVESIGGAKGKIIRKRVNLSN
ncbi:hypothetical protein PXD56_16495 [Maribacter sp. SA7]|uniref:hypothetical protein n=1 Tax=Maribacter zhoushanensis TaxID=3030012 RepID=UPI0023EC0835|nr:hypothetical protein [Maribacter zhoushanensis]MDF4204573.1 hypothetical protein [Maribacter zhoushanensis]